MNFDLSSGSSALGKKMNTGPLSIDSYYGDSGDLYGTSTSNNLFQPISGKDGVGGMFNSNMSRSSGNGGDKNELFLRDNAPSLQKSIYGGQMFQPSTRNQVSSDIFMNQEKVNSMSFSRTMEKDAFSSSNGPMSFYNHPPSTLSRTLNSGSFSTNDSVVSSIGSIRNDQSNLSSGASQPSRLSAFPSVGQTSPSGRGNIGQQLQGSVGHQSSQSQQPTIGTPAPGGAGAARSMFNHLTNSSNAGFTSPSRMSPNLSHMQQQANSYTFSGAGGLNTKRSNSPSMSAFNSFSANVTSGRASSHSFGSISPANNLQQSSNLLTSGSSTPAPSGDSMMSQKQNLTTFDMHEFPALTQKHNQLGGIGSTVGRNYGMVSKVNGEPNSEFTLQNEDFPTLPGSVLGPKSRSLVYQTGQMENYMSSHSGGDDSQYSNGQQMMSYRGSDKSEGSGMYDPMKKQGIQTYGDGLVTNIPRGMVTDQFGIVGLLTFIRAAERDSNLVALALGSDLQNLGLNLTSHDLFSTFQSPFAETPCRPQDIDFFVPSEYLTNLHIRDRLAPIKLSKYGEDTLFYLFYTNINDVLQLAAAAELFAQDWRYHKGEKLWLTRAPGYTPTKFETYEQGTYLFFDPKQWRKVPREFRLDYDKLEERPQLPTSLNYHPAHSQVH